ncbi:hypothetical protein PO613_33910, partial [Streptomyces heilongjiangensis]|nr:hypothetical protein [Streptomyces heilongjiangensis]
TPALPLPAASRPGALPAQPVVQRSPLRPHAPTSSPPHAPTPPRAPTHAAQPATPAPKPTPLQRNAPHPTPAHTTSAVSPVTAHRTARTTTTGAAPAAATGTSAGDADAPPEYVAVPKGQFDPRTLSDFQLDELTHRLIGRITRLVRTELRLDRERIGRLRDPRH